MRTPLRQPGRRSARTVTACLACLAMGSGPLAVAAQDPGACGRSPNPALHAEGLGVLLDSARLSSTLARDWEQGWGYTIASLRYDSTGALAEVSVRSNGTPDRALRGLESTLRDALSATWDEGRSAYLILGDEDGPGLMRAERFNGCAPSILNRDAMNQAFLRELLKENPRPMGTAMVMGLVDEKGRITRARVTRSSGDGRLDRAAVAALRRGRFTPATVEGIPVAVWTSMPMTARAH